MENKIEAQRHLESGNTFYAQGKYTEACNEYQKAIEKNPDYVGAYYNWGTALSKQKKYDEAIEKYQKAIEKNPDYADAYYNWGIALSKQKKYDEAIEKYRKAIEINPNDADAYYNWGLALCDQKKYDEAIEKYRKAIEKIPDYASAYYNWGLALYDQKKYDEAIEKYQKAIEVDSKYVHAYHNWGLALYNQKRYEGAIEQFEEAIKVDPNYAYSYHNIAHILWKQGKYKKAREKWEEACRMYKATKEKARAANDAEHFAFYGGVLLEVFAKLEEAEEVFREGLKIDPKHVGMLINRVSLYNARERNAEDRRDPKNYNEYTEEMMTYHSKAWDAYRTAEQILAEKLKAADDASTHLQAGELYFIVEEYDKAMKHLLEPSTSNSEDLAAYVKLGIIYTNKEEFTKAIKYLKDACKRDPQDFTIRSCLAEAYLKSGQFENAEREYLDVLRISPYHIESEIGLGEVYKEMGEKDTEFYSQAIFHFSNALTKSQLEHRSKRLTHKELASVYYSLGYTRNALYKTSKSLRDENLLKEALRDFKKCQENDPFHQKAKRAIEKIKKKYDVFSPGGIVERISPWVIFFISLFIFSASQVSFYVGKPTLCVVQSQSRIKFSKDVQRVLNDMGGQIFTAPDEFFNTLKQKIGEQKLNKLKWLLIRCVQRSNKLRWAESIDLGYYVLLTFGALIFMIAGFYLPNLSKMKFGTIELEKGPSAQITPSGGLDISK
ncbi:MAG: tetratricopeptide repeat protein [Candidatus Brocadia sp.]|nr:tetratricopeptide repeat protein [Candidatus Brocadia sp.]